MELDGLWIDRYFYCSEGLALISGDVQVVILFIGEHKL